VVNLYVEGGGDSAALKITCRKGFTEFITKAGIRNRPRVVACGSRRNAFESFCTAVANGTEAILLVDSEEAIDAPDGAVNFQPWLHLKNRKGDTWDKPSNSKDGDCHLMVQVMESWFLADRPCIEAYFGNGFSSGKLPAPERTIESIAKFEIYRALKDATEKCKTKSRYDKGEHSFELLARIDPIKVVGASQWAKRFIDELKSRLDDPP
jgi:Domain of unknown function (DUF4276)